MGTTSAYDGESFAARVPACDAEEICRERERETERERKKNFFIFL